MPIPLLKHILTSLLALITLSATAVNLQPYKFNGKEHDAVHGLDLLDYGARMYDNKTGRWTAVDPLAEDYYHVSPYAYCLNNPVKFVDPDGNYVESIWDIASFSLGFSSLIENINEKNYERALWDVGGLVFDGIAIIVPGMPGGAGVAIKGGRAADKVGDAVDAAKKVHGNSKLSTKAQHSYDIIDTKTNEVVKVGVSGGKIRKDGKSVRAETQVWK